jgi:pre-mRNA-splicing factor ATP-dependent RNA helicase DHX16
MVHRSTGRCGRRGAEQVIEINPEWLVEIAPHYYKEKDINDDSTKKLPKGVGRASTAQA